MSRYEFHELIATGGMGEVWRATDTALERDVAIKLLKPEFAGDPVNRQRFDSEARHAAALHHPHVAAVYDVGEMPTASGLMRPYLVMELVDGKPLSDLIRDGRPLDPDAVRDLLGQAGDALAAAHRAGIVHRDVKPANLLVTPDRQVKVTDFGIARAAASGAITGTGQVMGTPQYLSPEQARGEVATPASDVYSLGVVAFECLTGYRPFQKETPVATAIAHLHDPVPELPDSVPADLRALVMRALAKNPAERYPDAAAFTAALRGLGSSRTDTPATGVTMVSPLPVDPSATAVMPVLAGTAGGAAAAGAASAAGTDDIGAAYAGEQRRRPWYKSWFNIALLILLVLVIVAVGWLFWFVTAGGDGAAPTRGTAASTATTPTHSASAARHVRTTKPFDLDEQDFIGRNVDDVLQQLRDRGLRPHTEVVDNDGSHEPDTVSGLDPSRNLLPGDPILVRYYGERPEPPTPSHTPSPSQSPTPSESPAPSESPSQSPSSASSGPSSSSSSPGGVLRP